MKFHSVFIWAPQHWWQFRFIFWPFFNIQMFSSWLKSLNNSSRKVSWIPFFETKRIWHMIKIELLFCEKIYFDRTAKFNFAHHICVNQQENREILSTTQWGCNQDNTSSCFFASLYSNNCKLLCTRFGRRFICLTLSNDVCPHAKMLHHIKCKSMSFHFLFQDSFGKHQLATWL